MTILALDCSTIGLSLALQSGTETFTFTTATPRSSDVLPAELANLFTQSGTTAANLTQVLTTTGPGSFTGIRLGLATAEALKLINPALTITGLSTLHALARQIVTEHAPTTPFTIILDAAGGQAYTQTFNSTAIPITEAHCIPTHQADTEYRTLNTEHRLYAPANLMLNAHPLPTLNAATLFKLAEDPATHLPAHPVYLKPLTYKPQA